MKLPWRRKRDDVVLPAPGTASADLVRSFFFPKFWGASNDALVLKAFQDIAGHVAPGVHFADNFFAWQRNNSLLDDERFMSAWESNAESASDKAIVWRRYILACAGYHCVQLDGDFVECGAYAGVGAKTVIDYLGGEHFPRRFWLYDLFEHAEGMAHHAMPEHGPDLHARVQRKFGSYPQVSVVKGRIPEVFEGRSPAAISYLHIDLNEAPAEIAALEALFDRVVSGGIVVLDDYEWSGPYRPQKLAEDPWLAARRHKVFPLPTGQGIVLKR